MNQTEILTCEMFPVKLALITERDNFFEIADNLDEDGFECARYFPPAKSAHTMAIEAHNMGLVILVTLGDPEDSAEEETESILTHEAVHVWQFVKKAIREKKAGIETEAYAIQYYARWLIQQFHYRQQQAKKKSKKK